MLRINAMTPWITGRPDPSLFYETCRASNSVWKIGISSLIRMTQSKARPIENLAFCAFLMISERFSKCCYFGLRRSNFDFNYFGHSVWKSHSTLRAKQATLSGQKLIKNAKNGQFGRIFEKLKLAVKQCYQTGQFNRTKLF